MNFHLMIKWLIAFLLLSLSFNVPAKSTANQDSLEIQQALQNMTAAWNKCDLPTFMHIYENSSDTIYISSSGVIRGYQAITGQYKKHYPDCGNMGKININILDIYNLSPTNALVIGQWSLNRTVNHQSQKLGGIFSLALRKNNQGWHIFVDHTS